MSHKRPANGLPSPTCPCAECAAHRLSLWRALSLPKRRLLVGLAHGPRTWDDLRVNQRARWNTIETALAAGLIRMRDLRDGPLLSDRLRTFIDITWLGRVVLHAGSLDQRNAA